MPQLGQVLKQGELARTYRQLANIEKRSGGDRTRGLLEARDFFYAGPIARKIVKFASKYSVRDATGKPQSGLIRLPDLSEYETRVEETVAIDYKDLTVHKCGP